MFSVSQILERYLGLDPSPSGQGVTWTWEFDPPVALNIPAACGLLLAAVVLLVALSRRDLHRVHRRVRYGILGLRLVSISVLALMVCRLSVHVLRTGDPVVAVLVDTSASMGVSDEYDSSIQARLDAWPGLQPGSRRIDLVHRLLGTPGGGWLDEVGEGRRIELFTFAEDLVEAHAADRRSSAKADRGPDAPVFSPVGRRTNLRSSLENLLNRYRGSPPAAVLVLTDGISTTGPSNTLSEGAGIAAGMRVPLFVVGVGSSRAVKDLAIAEVRTDSVAFLGDSHSLQVKLHAARAPSGKTLVVLSQAGHPDVLDSAEAVFGGDQTTVTVELSHTPDVSGPVDYEVSVRPISGESNLQNNRAQARVWVREERLNVLFIERLPRWEFRHVKAVLERDNTVELKTWLQDADAEFVREDRTALNQLPESLEELSTYDAVILGDVDPGSLPGGFAGALAEFVSSLGGGLLFIAGPKHLPGDYLQGEWGKLIPVEAGGQDAEISFSLARGTQPGWNLRPTVEGRAHPVLRLHEASRAVVWGEFPPVYGVTANAAAKEAAQVLLTAVAPNGNSMHPLLVSHRFGAGTVLLQLFDESWRWRSLDGGAHFRRYWSQAVRFLSKRKAIDDHPRAVLRTDRTEYVSGETVKLSLVGASASESAEPLRAVIVGPQEQTREVALQPASGQLAEYGAQIEELPEGTYSARLLTDLQNSHPLVASWKVLSVDPERIFQPMNERDLKRAAELTGGKFYHVWEAARMADQLPRGGSRQLKQRKTVPLWNRWDMLLVLAAALVGEWTLRKRYRLL